MSSLYGIENRSTIDIDFCLENIPLKKETLIKIINEIADIEIDDGIAFEVIGYEEIRKEDKYGGLQIHLIGKLENIKVWFNIDVATGDPIIPGECRYNYKCLVTGDCISLKVYSIESVVAEKLETVLSRGIANSRCKDYYDLYIIRKTQVELIN